MRMLAALLLGFCLALSLTACGNKGPLELPDEDTEKRERSSY